MRQLLSVVVGVWSSQPPGGPRPHRLEERRDPIGMSSPVGAAHTNPHARMIVAGPSRGRRKTSHVQSVQSVARVFEAFSWRCFGPIYLAGPSPPSWTWRGPDGHSGRGVETGLGIFGKDDPEFDAGMVIHHPGRVVGLDPF